MTAIATGKFTDPFDGSVYRTVLMPDGKWWFRDNYRANRSGSVVYGGDSANAPIYGRLYSVLTNPEIPSGTHIPLISEWVSLVSSVGSNANLKLSSSSLWNSNPQGTDDYLFNGVPGGYYLGELGYNNKGVLCQYKSTYGNYINFGPTYNFQYQTTPVNWNYYFSMKLIVDSGNVPDNALYVGSAGSWKKVTQVYIGSGGLWKPATLNVGQNGAWRHV